MTESSRSPYANEDPYDLVPEKGGGVRGALARWQKRRHAARPAGKAVMGNTVMGLGFANEADPRASQNKARIEAVQARTAESTGPVGRFAKVMNDLEAERSRRIAERGYKVGTPYTIKEEEAGEQLHRYSQVVVLDQLSHRNRDAELGTLVAKLPPNPLLSGNSQIDHITIMRHTETPVDPNTLAATDDEFVLTVESVQGADRYTHGIRLDTSPDGQEQIRITQSKQNERNHFAGHHEVSNEQAAEFAGILADAFSQAYNDRPEPLV